MTGKREGRKGKTLSLLCPWQHRRRGSGELRPFALRSIRPWEGSKSSDSRNVGSSVPERISAGAKISALFSSDPS